MVRAFMIVALASMFGCGGAMSGKLGNAACEAGCDEAKNECVSRCAEEADKTACELACDEARSKCESDCKK